MTGVELKKHRNNRGWTQTELGEKIGVGVRTIQNYETGQDIPASKHAILRKVFFGENDEKTQKIIDIDYLEVKKVKISLREIATFISKYELAMEKDELFRQFKNNIKKQAIIEYYEKNGFKSNR